MGRCERLGSRGGDDEQRPSFPHPHLQPPRRAPVVRQRQQFHHRNPLRKGNQLHVPPLRQVGRGAREPFGRPAGVRRLRPVVKADGGDGDLVQRKAPVSQNRIGHDLKAQQDVLAGVGAEVGRFLQPGAPAAGIKALRVRCAGGIVRPIQPLHLPGDEGAPGTAVVRRNRRVGKIIPLLQIHVNRIVERRLRHAAQIDRARQARVAIVGALGDPQPFPGGGRRVQQRNARGARKGQRIAAFRGQFVIVGRVLLHGRRQGSGQRVDRHGGGRIQPRVLKPVARRGLRVVVDRQRRQPVQPEALARQRQPVGLRHGVHRRQPRQRAGRKVPVGVHSHLVKEVAVEQ
ncbi:hypothetical protein RZS08_06025, partial [Arthrospira platensis SPKY1]|nr:hypothetical protein [Arthrospira platensis SPKY1]